MADFTRRSAIGAASVGAAGLTLSAVSSAAAQGVPAPVPAFAGNHQPRPLKFDPAKLTGLSEKLITSHWQNNYQGSVKGPNTIEQKLAAAMADKDFAAPIYSGLTREELDRTGSVVLHEYYFDNMTPGGSPMPSSGKLLDAINSSFGSLDLFRADFKPVATMRGVGWAIAFQDPTTKSISNHWVTLHNDGNPAGYKPILIMDAWEHAFVPDYKPTERGKYVEAYLQNIDWKAVEGRAL